MQTLGYEHSGHISHHLMNHLKKVALLWTRGRLNLLNHSRTATAPVAVLEPFDPVYSDRPSGLVKFMMIVCIP